MNEISVIIPIYNGGKFITKCIESILNQSFSDFEIILVDDGSNDNSVSIIKRYAANHNNIKAVFQKNGGVSSARNAGIKVATGKYVAFIDADDQVKEEYLKQLHNHAEVDYIVSGIINRYTNLDGYKHTEDVYSILHENRGRTLSELPRDFFVNGFIHSCCGKLYRLEIIKRNNVKFPKVRLSEDSFFNIEYLKYIKSWRIVECAGYIYMHRQNEKSATSKFEKKDINIYEKLHEAMLELPVKKAYVNSTLYSQYLAICLKLLRQKEPNKKKKEELGNILKNTKIKKTLLLSANNVGEWITGAMICTKNVKLINNWLNIIKR